MGNACPARNVQKIAPKITSQEVRERGYLIIFGKVYDTHEYLSKHPGGPDILLSVAGRDASGEFVTMRHSDLALKQMERLCVGTHDESKTSEIQERRQNEEIKLTGGRSSLSLPCAADKFWDVDERGFLPAQDPVKELPRPWQQLVELVDIMPAYSIQGQFQQLADSQLRGQLFESTEQVKAGLESLLQAELECLHSVLGYICLGYMHDPPSLYESASEEAEDLMGKRIVPDTLPAWLAVPWVCVSEKLERRPALDYAGCVLNNWERIDPLGPVSPQNVRLLRRFTGLVDEEWFFKTHIIIEAEGSHVVGSLLEISSAIKMNDCHKLLQELHSLEEALWRLSSVCLPIMYTRSPEDHSLLCDPFLFFFYLRTYIGSTDVKMEIDQEIQNWHLKGPSGAMSAILPCVDSLLGICNTSAELREAMKCFERYIPLAHRRFLDRLRDGTTVKMFIESGRETMEQSAWYALAGAYNACLSRVLDFRWRHWGFVEHFMVRPSSADCKSTSICPMATERSGNQPPLVGTGGTTFDYLQQHITDSQVARISIAPENASLRTPEPRCGVAPLPDLPPLEGLALWDPTGVNGFASHRKANLPDWRPPYEAPLPGCQALLHLSNCIPSFCFTHPGLEHSEDFQHPFPGKCDQRQLEILSLIKPGKEGTPAENLSAEDLEYTWLLLSTVASAYWTTCSKPVLEETPAATCPATGNAGISMRPVAGLKRAREESLAVLPEWLVDVILHLEGLVGRPWSGTPEYCELVLNNWHVPSQALHRSANEESESETFIISRDSIHLVHPISRFLAIPWEEWLRKFQLVLEAEGGRAVSHAHRRLTPAISRRDNATVVAALNEFAGKIESLVEFQTQQFRLKDSRGDHIIATRLRTFVAKGWSDEEVAAWVYTGSSPLLPAMHALLGLRKMDGIYGPLQENWQVLGRQNMPESHRQFLDALEHSVSVRAYCLREWRKAPVELIAALEDSFNNCIETLLRYCNLRQRLANRMFPGAGRVRQLSSWQEKVVRSGRLSLLQMRRVADLHKMRMMKTPLLVAGW